MKTIALLTAALVCLSPAAFPQGSLTPPGPPGPTMKTLDQVEPRKPIAGGSSGVMISEPGSYYLTGNIRVASGNAITVAADDVSIDLMGFTLSTMADPAAGDGIGVTGSHANLAITNGHVRSVGAPGTSFTGGSFVNGININPPNFGRVYNVRVSNVSVHGGTGKGISITPFGESVVTNCVVQRVGDQGIQARLVRDCSVVDSGSNGIGADVVENCTVFHNNASTGISASIVSNCRGSSGSGNGINAFSSVINSSGASQGAGHGIQSETVSNSKGTSGSGRGISAVVASNSRGSSGSGVGLFAERNATNCDGVSTSGAFGLQVGGTASFCSGERVGGIAIKAANATGCATFGGTVDAPQKFLGTP